ncbi:MAG: hypothetical protein V3V06_01400 [Dehalococcoidia bacterium]
MLTRMGLGLLLVAVLAGAVSATPLAGRGQAQETAPSAAPTFVTFFNPANVSRLVQLRLVLESGATTLVSTHAVGAEDTTTFALAAELLAVEGRPTNFVAVCSGCRDAPFALAAGQRIILLIRTTSAAAANRSDVFVVNESSGRRTGALRTGAVAGAGRSVIGFDLQPGEGTGAGMRFRSGETVDFNLTCGGCAAQFARVGNGVDLEIVIR